MKKYFYLLLVFVITNKSFAQYIIPSKESCDKLKSRTLLVEIFDDNSEYSNEYNKVIQNSFKDAWKYTEVEFLQTKDFLTKIASGDEKYAVFHPYKAKYIQTTQYERNNSVMSSPYSWQKSDKEPVISNISRLLGQWNWVYESFGFGISLLSPKNAKSKEQPMCIVLFANDNLSSSDLLFTTQQLAALINAGANNISGLDYYNPKKNIEYIKTKTLLIPEELVSEKDALKIKDKYEYACKILPAKEINNLALSKDDQYVITRIIFIPQFEDYGWITYSPKDGAVKSIMAFGGVKISANQKPNEIIKVRHFKYILSSMAQNMNNKYK